MQQKDVLPMKAEPTDKRVAAAAPALNITGAEAVIRSLIAEGVETIFGYPGGAIMPIYDALYDFRTRYIIYWSGTNRALPMPRRDTPVRLAKWVWYLPPPALVLPTWSPAWQMHIWTLPLWFALPAR